MGNSNSSHHNHHQAPLQWSQSLEGPDNRNRMKKGYFPGRPYVGPGHKGMNPAQKVLPTVNPTEAAMRLKPTSNGAILHKGGTISGRKLQLLNELASKDQIESFDMIEDDHDEVTMNGNVAGRRRHYSGSSIMVGNDSTSLNGDLNGGLSTPNLDQFPSNDFSRRSQRSIGGHRIIIDKGVMNGNNRFGSEPDLTRDTERAQSRERSVSPLPNSFTLISESPAKKQIRTKKKSQAPPPPRSGSSNGFHDDGGSKGMNHFGRNSERSMSIDSDKLLVAGGDGKKKMNRLFKTKAETKLSNASGSASPGSKGGDSCSSSERRILAESIILTPLKPERPWSHKMLSKSSNVASSSSNRVDKTGKEQLAKRVVNSESSPREPFKSASSSPSPLASSAKEDGNRRENDNQLPHQLQTSKEPLRKRETGVSARSEIKTDLKQSAAAPSASASSTTSLTSTFISTNRNESRISTTTKTHTTSSKSSTQINIHSVDSTTKNITAGSDGVGASKPRFYYYDNGQDASRNNAASKKTFYFGMDDTTAPDMKELAPSSLQPSSKVASPKPGKDSGKQAQNSSVTNGRLLERNEPKSLDMGVKNIVVNIKKYNENETKTSSNGNVDKPPKQASSNAKSPAKAPAPLAPHSRQDQFKIDNNTPLLNGSSNPSQKPKQAVGRQVSDSDSDGFRHQITHSIVQSKVFAEIRGKTSAQGKSDGKDYLPEDSSSDLSSSDVDIPMLIRPTLPQRRLDLPRFSPSAAWRALDSPRASGRSLSSEDGFTFEDRIQRYTRPSAPPRNNTERSGDSGISAGDAASPANAAPDIGERHSSCSQSTSNNNPNMVTKSHGNRKSGDHSSKNGTESIMKCWTPEQDLDESSSEFEHDIPYEDDPLELEVGHRRRQQVGVPPGSQTPPKFTTRSALFGKSPSSSLSGRPRNEFVYKNQGSNGFGSSGDSPSPQFNSRPSKTSQDQNGQPHHYVHQQQLYTRSSKNVYRKNETELEYNINNVVQVNSDNDLDHRSSSRVAQSGYHSEQPRQSRPNRYKPNPRQQSSRPKQDPGFVGLDTNWFLSRSEPNSLNTISDYLDNQRGAKLSLVPPGAERLGLLDKIFPLEEEHVEGSARKNRSSQDSRSEIGYGPSSMSFFSTSNNDSGIAGDMTESQSKKPFSHIMYLPAYDSRRASPYNSNKRRTKSVDALDSKECKLFQSEYKDKTRERFSRRDYIERALRTGYYPEPSEPLESSAPKSEPRIIHHQIRNEHEEELNNTGMNQLNREKAQDDFNAKKKKFKFQSTLRVQERKKIEEQLAREAEEKEMQRLREIEAMKKVEEEFQRKRAQREKSLEIELNLHAKNNDEMRKTSSGGGSSSNAKSEIRGEWDDFRDLNRLNNNKLSSSAKNKSSASVTSSQNGGFHASKSGNKKMVNGSSDKFAMSQRQEPEGAPSMNSTTDLRKELIHASRKRNAGSQNGSSHGGRASSEATQELSEWRQETRQYCDYRRSPRTQSASPARFIESSNSDIFPVSRKAPVERSKQNRYKSTVHPEIVCDIPVKPLPFMVNFARLSGSTSNLVTMEERPGSGMGYASGPSSVISDNYRRDWAHHVRGGSAYSGPGKASSIASLHSSPGYTSDHLRHSVTDLTAQDNKSTKSSLFHKYSSSPPSSPIPPLSSNTSEFTDIDKDSSSMITSSNPPSGMFQLQPYKAKGYRPVAFKPRNTNDTRSEFKLASTVVQ